jgi:hypothetical protein
MDAHNYARLASLLSAERQVVATALARFRTHDIGTDWRGRTRHEAHLAVELAVDTCTNTLATLDDAEREALRLWREALTASSPLGM